MKVLTRADDHARLIILSESHARCVECGLWLVMGWSYQDKPYDGNYIECSDCRYGEPDNSEYARGAK